jgi:hypothetical protein
MRKFLAIVLGAALFAYGQAQILAPILYAKNHSASVTWTLATGPTLSSACTATSASCNLTVTTVSGHVGIFGMVNPDGANLSAVTLNGSASNVYCYGCSNSLTTCYVNDSATNFTSDCGYILPLSNNTSVTLAFTRSNTTSGAWRVWYAECVKSSGSISLDTGSPGVRDQTTNTTSPLGVSLTLQGSNDCIVQAISANTSAISSPYSTNAVYAATGGVGVALTQSSGTAPTWTTTSNKSALSAIAFK